jgi:hypothetical protein
MYVFSDNAMKVNVVDGISLLPNDPGIYAMWNKNSQLWNIGKSINMRQRCSAHRAKIKAGNADNMRIRRDAEIHGADSFFYCVLERIHHPNKRSLQVQLTTRELWWVMQFNALDERYGYNLDAGGSRSPAARFRDRERKLMRGNSRKYVILPSTDMHAPINTALLNSWIPGS